MSPTVSNIIIIVIVAVILFFAIRNSIPILRVWGPAAEAGERVNP